MRRGRILVFLFLIIVIASALVITMSINFAKSVPEEQPAVSEYIVEEPIEQTTDLRRLDAGPAIGVNSRMYLLGVGNGDAFYTYDVFYYELPRQSMVCIAGDANKSADQECFLAEIAYPGTGCGSVTQLVSDSGADFTEATGTDANEAIEVNLSSCGGPVYYCLATDTMYASELNCYELP